MKSYSLLSAMVFFVGMTLVCTRLAIGEELRSEMQTPAGARSAYVKANIIHGPYGEVKVVVALTSDDKVLQRMKLANINNSLKAADAWGGKFMVKVVLYGKGLTLLKNPDAESTKQLDTLRGHGVQFLVCDNSLAAFGIDFHTLYGVSGSDVVPSGFAEVAYLQAKKGYVVDPAN